MICPKCGTNGEVERTRDAGDCQAYFYCNRCDRKWEKVDLIDPVELLRWIEEADCISYGEEIVEAIKVCLKTGDFEPLKKLAGE